jgi:hypothetical protein
LYLCQTARSTTYQERRISIGRRGDERKIVHLAIETII